jgi:hypothetical protein
VVAINHLLPLNRSNQLLGGLTKSCASLLHRIAANRSTCATHSPRSLGYICPVVSASGTDGRRMADPRALTACFNHGFTIFFWGVIFYPMGTYYTTGVNPSRGLRAISNFFSFCQSMLSAAPVCARGPAILRPSVPEAETTGHKCERGRGE